MSNSSLPQIGESAPSFTAKTQNGDVQFPQAFKGHWTIFFAHPGNFTSAWVMYSSILVSQERNFSKEGVKLLALSNMVTHKRDFSENVRRFIGIYLKSPVADDQDFEIANLYGMASRRHREQSRGRLVYIIDPEGVIRHIVENPQPSIEVALKKVMEGLREAKGLLGKKQNPPIFDLEPVEERLDVDGSVIPNTPAYFNKEKKMGN